MTLWETLERSRERFPDKPALLYEQEAWTYRVLEERSRRLARGLLAAGIGPGDRIALHFRNRPEFICACYAAFAIGAIAVPIHPILSATASEAAYVLEHSGARAYLGQSDLYAPLEAQPGALSKLAVRGVLGADPSDGTIHPFERLMDTGVGTASLPAVDEHAPAVLIHTSGSTARPKGIIHSHASLTAIAEICEWLVDIDSSDLLGMVVPASHMLGLGLQLIPAVRAGAALLLFAGSFDPVRVLAAFERHLVTLCIAAPTLYAALIDAPGAADRDLASVRACMAGGDSVAPELLRRFRSTFGVAITEGYGLTEAAPAIANEPFGEKRAGSMGRPCSGVTVRLVDDHGNEVADGETGEILLRTAGRMIGYWNDPEATAAAFDGEWLRTGDLARRDAGGWYWFAGRKKEIIVRYTMNVSPQEVEERFCEHPAVREAGVVGVPDPPHGEAIVGYVSLREGYGATAEEIDAFLTGRLSTHKIPGRIVVLPDLPKGATGKVNRRLLKERAMEALDSEETGFRREA